jgi:rare lipoprotein A
MEGTYPMRKDYVPRAGYPASSPLYRTYFIVLCVATIISEARAESGLASYYSYGNRGRPGEMTCAHRTRPFGSMIKVSYGDRSIDCRVTDRGPFIRGRVIDLSLSAAQALGMMSSGVVRVSLEYSRTQEEERNGKREETD